MEHSDNSRLPRVGSSLRLPTHSVSEKLLLLQHCCLAVETFDIDIISDIDSTVRLNILRVR